MQSVFDILGYYGPSLLMLLNVWNLRYRAFHIFLFATYILGVILLTKLLKGWIRDPRPYGYNHPINNEWMHDFDYSGSEIYGMPSGHSATIFFSLVYLYLYSPKPMKTTYMILGGFISILTLYQRYHYRKHTIVQLVVGAILGCLLAYIGYVANSYIFV